MQPESPLDFEAWEEAEAEELYIIFHETGANYDHISDRQKEAWLERQYELYLYSFNSSPPADGASKEVTIDPIYCSPAHPFSQP